MINLKGPLGDNNLMWRFLAQEKIPSPSEVLNSLCSFANTNLLENCNLNSFDFDEVFEKDLSGWRSDSKVLLNSCERII